MRTRVFLKCLFLLVTGVSSASVPVGSVVIYSDGTVEKLLQESEGELHWEDGRKRLFVRSSNPILPPLKRTDFLSGRGYSQRISSGDPDAIRSLPEGTPLEFSLLRTTHKGASSKRNWECTRLGTSNKRVLGTMRQLENYVCERFVIHRKLHNRSFREKTAFSYSPDLDVVVEFHRKTRKRDSSRTLVSVLPPGKADYKRISSTLAKIRAGR